jgi:putative transposase
VEQFVRWYNVDHLHSGIGFVTPEARHRGRDVGQLETRRAVYAAARAKHPGRWSGVSTLTAGDPGSAHEQWSTPS